MSPLIEGKVLRLLQEQSFERVGGNESIHTDVRIIAATNRPLEQMVARRMFREDLLFRLNGYTIFVPPLAQRREDIPLLLEHYLVRAKQEMGRPDLRGISSDALALLMRYDWPGNVRQLQSVVRQSLLSSTGPVIDEEHLPNFIRDQLTEDNLFGDSSGGLLLLTPENSSDAEPISGAQAKRVEPHTSTSPAGEETLTKFIERRLSENTEELYSETLEQMERVLFEKVLQETRGNKTRAAKLLGISRAKVRERAAAYSINDTET